MLLKYDKKSHFLRKFFFSIKFPQFREFSLQFRETWRSRPISGDSRKFRETWQVCNHVSVKFGFPEFRYNAYQITDASIIMAIPGSIMVIVCIYLYLYLYAVYGPGQ